jgi:TIR domain
MPDPIPRVFLAHRSTDKPAAEALATTLRQDHGLDVWLDRWDIRGGDDFVAAMQDGIAAAHGGLVLLGDQGVAGWTGEEVAALLYRHVEHQGPGPRPFVIPVKLHPAVPVPLFLATRHPLPVDDPARSGRLLPENPGHGPRVPMPYAQHAVC